MSIGISRILNRAGQGEGDPMVGAETRPRGRRAWSPEASDEIAAVLRVLMVRPWLVSGRDDELIAGVRRNETALRDVFARLGWVLVVERDLVRLRKSPPPRREAFAASGPNPLTCSWFFLLVAAAEGLPPKVSIAQLVTAARAAAAEAALPVTHDMPERRAIAAALRLLDGRGVIERMDGDLDGFLTDENAPVLLAVHHTRLLHVVANFASADPVADPNGWLALVEREPDPSRRMRRRLVDDVCVHAEDLDPEEADWLRRRVRGDDGAPLAGAFGLHLERRAEGAAFIVPDDAFRHLRELGPCAFPAPGTVGHAALLLIDASATAGATHVDRPGWRVLTEAEVHARLAAWGRDIGAGRGGWSAEDVENPILLASKVSELLTGLDLVRLEVKPADDSCGGDAPSVPGVPGGTAGLAPAGSSVGDRPATCLWWFSPVTGRWAAQPAARAATKTRMSGSPESTDTSAPSGAQRGGRAWRGRVDELMLDLGDSYISGHDGQRKTAGTDDE